MTRNRRRRLGQIPGAVHATPERMAQAGEAYDEMSETLAGGTIKRSGAVRVWSALENLYRNGLLTGPQRDAGEKFYADWYIGFHAPSQTTMKWSDYVSGLGADSGSMGAAERRVFHVRRFQDANRLLDTFEIRKPIHWLVINDIVPQDVGRRFRGYRGKDKAASSGTTTIAIGLQGLAKFYGLVK
jgi:hypothetical protein